MFTFVTAMLNSRHLPSLRKPLGTILWMMRKLPNILHKSVLIVGQGQNGKWDRGTVEERMRMQRQVEDCVSFGCAARNSQLTSMLQLPAPFWHC